MGGECNDRHGLEHEPSCTEDITGVPTDASVGQHEYADARSKGNYQTCGPRNDTASDSEASVVGQTSGQYV